MIASSRIARLWIETMMTANSVTANAASRIARLWIETTTLSFGRWAVRLQPHRAAVD